MIGLGLVKLLSPRVWLIAGLALLFAAYTGGVYYAGGVGPRAELEELEESIQQAIAERLMLDERDAIARAEISDRREAEHATQLASLDRRYAAVLERLRSDTRGPGEAPSLSAAASFLGCTDGRADAAKRLERLETGILRALQRGDRAIHRTIACKAWLDEQMKRPLG